MKRSGIDNLRSSELVCRQLAKAQSVNRYDTRFKLSDQIRTGLQMENFRQDIGRDYENGRIYLPRQHFAQHGLCEDDLLEPRPDDRLVCLIEDEIRRTKKLYKSGWEIWDSLDDDGRPIFSMIWRTYRRLLDRTAENPRAVATRKIQLSAAERTGLLSKHYFAPLFHRLPVPPTEITEGKKVAEAGA